MSAPADDRSLDQGTSLSLLERARTRDDEAWERLHRLYQPFVVFWCGRWGVREEDRDDVAQEVFRAAVNNLSNFRRDRPGDSFRGWLRGITHNMVLMHFRRVERSVQAVGGSSILENLQQVPTPTESDDTPEEIGRLYRRALDYVRGEFEERSWQMFWRTAIDDRSPPDVAAEMGVTPAAVRQAKSRVLRRLKEEVGDLLD